MNLYSLEKGKLLRGWDQSSPLLSKQPCYCACVLLFKFVPPSPLFDSFIRSPPCHSISRASSFSVLLCSSLPCVDARISATYSECACTACNYETHFYNKKSAAKLTGGWLVFCRRIQTKNAKCTQECFCLRKKFYLLDACISDFARENFSLL